MAMSKKVKVSSPTTGNPYGRTGAPGKVEATDSELEQTLGRPVGGKLPASAATDPRFAPVQQGGALPADAAKDPRFAPMVSPAEQRLRAAPPPKPQTPNLNALKMRQARPPAQPPMRSPQDQAALQSMYSTYMPQQGGGFDAHQFNVMADAANALPRTARGGVRDLAPDGAQGPPMAQRAAIDSAAVDPSYQPPMPTLAESIERRKYLEGARPSVDAAAPPPAGAVPAALPGARLRRAEDVHFYDPAKPVSL